MLLGVLSAGCTVETEPAAEQRHEQTEQEATDRPARRATGSGISEDVFLTTVRDMSTTLGFMEDEELLDFGETACNFMDTMQPESFDEASGVLALMAIEAGLSEGQMADVGVVFGAATVSLCPRWDHLS